MTPGDGTLTDDKPLNAQVAEALGWTRLSGGPQGWFGRPPGGEMVPIDCYDRDWSVTGPLIEEYGIALEVLPSDAWAARLVAEARGETPLIAVCNLILVLVKEAGKL